MRQIFLKVGAVVCLFICLIIWSCKGKPSADHSARECRVGLVMPTTGGMAQYGAEGVIAARIALQDEQRAAKYSTPVLKEQDSASEPGQSNAAATVLLTSSDP